ncbi:VOC family protein [Gemmobacter denitrificans]|uniref:VOC family protein n=1 Tax=Gemmobacter denitrificans TaxID=3123040 RepID=A0ABU8BVI1_9RHOB
MADARPGIMDICLGCDDLARSIRFYDAVMPVVGLSRLPDAPKGWAGWGPAKGTGLWLCPPFNGQPASAGNGTMVTFRAESAAQVRGFHAAALAHAGADEGAPGTRPGYDPAFYVAYVRDPNGHKLACAFTAYDATEDRS